MRSDFLTVFSFFLLMFITSCQGGGGQSVNAARSSSTIVGLACSDFSLPTRTSANASQLSAADKIKNNCKIVFTTWHALPSQTWCPYLRGKSKVEYCGPYDNWGFMNSTDDPNAFNLGGDIYNDFIIPNHPEWILTDINGETVTHATVPVEHAVDHGNMDFVDFYFDYFLKVPSSVRGGRWEGTYKERSWNMRFLDNYIVDAPWAWSSLPVNPATGKTFTREEREQDVLNATKKLRQRADNEAGGLKYFANIWSDVEAEYFDRDIYPELMQYLDYVLFETWTSNPEGVPESEEIWLRRVLAAQDMIQNRRAEPVVQTGYGDFWYALSTLLLVTENGRGMAWTKIMLSDNLLQKLKDFDLGEPLGVFAFIDNAYQRDWQKGKVVVNPADSGTVTISLGQNYEDVKTGNTVNSVTLPP